MTAPKFPPRKWLVPSHEGVQYAYDKQSGYADRTGYLSLDEHERLIREARAKAVELAEQFVFGLTVESAQMLRELSKTIREGKA